MSFLKKLLQGLGGPTHIGECRDIINKSKSTKPCRTCDSQGVTSTGGTCNDCNGKGFYYVDEKS